MAMTYTRGQCWRFSERREGSFYLGERGDDAVYLWDFPARLVGHSPRQCIRSPYITHNSLQLLPTLIFGVLFQRGSDRYRQPQESPEASQAAGRREDGVLERTDAALGENARV